MFHFRDLPIRRKLTLIILLTSTVALLLASGAMAVYEFMRFRHALARELSIEAEIVASQSGTALAFSDPAAGSEYLRALQAQPGIVHACLFMPDGKVFAEFKSGRKELPPLTRNNPGHQFEKDYVVVFQDVYFGGELVGSIGLRSDLRRRRGGTPPARRRTHP